MSIRAYVNTKEVRVIPRSYKSKEGRHFIDYSVEIALDDSTKVELRAYLDEARGLYVDSDIPATDDLTKAFLPQIISVTTGFTMAEKLKDGTKRELGWYKEGDANALVEVYKYNKEQLNVTIEGKTLADIFRLWNEIQGGNILPYKLQIQTSEHPTVRTSELSQTVNDLRKRLEWALDEIGRADRIIASCNATQAEWERISREREEFIAELEAKSLVLARFHNCH